MAEPKISTMLTRLLESGYEVGIRTSHDKFYVETFLRADTNAERSWFSGDTLQKAIRYAYNSMYQKQ